MFIAILGRQPALGIAELESLYGSDSTRWFSDISATVATDDFDFERLGGSQKAGQVAIETRGDWRSVSREIVQTYEALWKNNTGKTTIGISAYGFPASARDVQKTGLTLKSTLKKHGVSVRLVPNVESSLNSATSHHNKLGLSANKIELLVVRNSRGQIIVAQSIGAQNITALAARDQGRPKRDAFVGMLPPKLARMIVNLGVGRLENGKSEVENSEKRRNNNSPLIILDPFCGTGVILQEAALLGYNFYGSDLADKMVDYSQQNLSWLADKYSLETSGSIIELGDAMNHKWSLQSDSDVAVACEAYLGQPFSAPPSPAKLIEVRGNCDHIISQFLKNIHGQLPRNTNLCVAIPAWRDKQDNFTHLPLVDNLANLGYQKRELKTARSEQLLYYRDNQVVGRELLLLRTT